MSQQTENKPEVQDPIPKTGFFKKLFHHPNFNAVSGVVTIISLIVAIYFGLDSIKKPSLTYYITSRTPIVQHQNKRITVLFDNTPINKDLSSAEIQIWNQGRLPLYRKDFREPLTIKTANGERIYQYNFATNGIGIGFEWLNQKNWAPGELQMDWEVMEQSDGVNIQIIHEGGTDVPLTINGLFVGQHGVKQYVYSKDTVSLASTFSFVFTVIAVFALMTTIAATRKYFYAKPLEVPAVFGEGELQRIIESHKQYLEEKRKNLLNGYVLVIGCILVIVLMQLIVAPQKPPFGP